VSIAVLKGELVRLLSGALSKRRYEVKDAAGATPAAVLVIIHYHEKNSPYVFLTKRGADLKSHRNEISFPGGRYAEGDGSLLETALRETKEEVGIKFAASDILGSLEPVRTMTSNHFIVPFVTVKDVLPQVRISAVEVAEVLDVPLVGLLETMEPDREHFRLSKTAVRFTSGENVVWGATARILKQLHELLIRPS
jgi:8-oxo-dGTP pyrophosphatase MutT (NUDIX family)